MHSARCLDNFPGTWCSLSDVISDASLERSSAISNQCTVVDMRARVTVRRRWIMMRSFITFLCVMSFCNGVLRFGVHHRQQLKHTGKILSNCTSYYAHDGCHRSCFFCMKFSRRLSSKVWSFERLSVDSTSLQFILTKAIIKTVEMSTHPLSKLCHAEYVIRQNELSQCL